MSTSLIAMPNPDQPDKEKFGGAGFPELPLELQKELKSLLRKALQREMYARRQEVMEARRQRFYDRGVQYIYWNYQNWGFAPLSGSSWGGDGVEQGNYEDVYNIYHPFLRAIIAALTSNSPGVHILPRTNRTADTIGAEAADHYREFIEQANGMKELQTEIARLLGTDGRVITEVVESKPNIRYGVGEDGEPLSAEIIEVSGVLESKVPITQNDMADWTYCILSKEFELEKLQEDYPDVVDEDGNSKISDSGDSSEIGRAHV